MLGRTTFGRCVYAVGGNAEAARLSGIPVGLIRTATLALSGPAAGLAGIVVASRVTTGQADTGAGLELSAIAAIVIGGTPVPGGQGSLWRTIPGVLHLTLTGNGINLLQRQPDLPADLPGRHHRVRGGDRGIRPPLPPVATGPRRTHHQIPAQANRASKGTTRAAVLLAADPGGNLYTGQTPGPHSGDVML